MLLENSLVAINDICHQLPKLSIRGILYTTTSFLMSFPPS